jgi:hypothetical protein
MRAIRLRPRDGKISERWAVSDDTEAIKRCFTTR